MQAKVRGLHHGEERDEPEAPPHHKGQEQGFLRRMSRHEKNKGKQQLTLTVDSFKPKSQSEMKMNPSASARLMAGWKS